MCLAAVAMRQIDQRLPAEWHLLAAAGSDGILRLFMFDVARRQMTLLSQSIQDSGCLLKVYIHLHRDPQSDHTIPLLLSSSTDGVISVWDLQPIIKRVSAVAEKKNNQARDQDSLYGRDNAKQNVLGEGDCNKENSAVDEDWYTSSDEETDDSDADYVKSKDSGYVLATAKQQSFSSNSGQSANTPVWLPNQVIKAHQSGVNSLHMKSLADGTLILASGGDDNALTVHRLRLAALQVGLQTRAAADGSSLRRHSGIELLKVESVAAKMDAHAAQITGVWVLSEQHVLSAGVDQRVNLWGISPQKQFQLECCRYVDISDVSNLDVWQHQDVVYMGLCGEGVALLSLSIPPPVSPSHG